MSAYSKESTSIEQIERGEQSRDSERHLRDEELEEEETPLPLFMAHEPDHITQFPNKWSRYRYMMREGIAEFLGVMILVIFGTGVDLQVVLSSKTSVAPAPKGEYLSISFGWAVGTGIGIWVSGGYSGGHINPAVTISQAIFRKFPWRKVPVYIVSQVLGGFVGGLLVYADYAHAIDAYEGKGIRTVPGTASLFSTYAADYETNVAAFFDEFLGTAVLLIAVFALTDKKNGPPPPGLVPLAIFLLVLGIGAALGINTAYAINPARDLGPRLMTAIFYGREVWTYRNQYWLWCPIMGPILGAIVGAGLYDALLFTGSESFFNAPSRVAKRNHQHAGKAARDKIPAGVDDKV